MTCNPEGRQEYADGHWLSIEPGKHCALAPKQHIILAIWRRYGRRYRLPGLHSNNEYSTVFWGLNWQPR